MTPYDYLVSVYLCTAYDYNDYLVPMCIAYDYNIYLVSVYIAMTTMSIWYQCVFHMATMII